MACCLRGWLGMPEGRKKEERGKELVQLIISDRQRDGRDGREEKEEMEEEVGKEMWNTHRCLMWNTHRCLMWNTHRQRDGASDERGVPKDGGQVERARTAGGQPGRGAGWGVGRGGVRAGRMSPCLAEGAWGPGIM